MSKGHDAFLSVVNGNADLTKVLQLPADDVVALGRMVERVLVYPVVIRRQRGNSLLRSQVRELIIHLKHTAVTARY
jgi:hypothetical protein